MITTEAEIAYREANESFLRISREMIAEKDREKFTMDHVNEIMDLVHNGMPPASAFEFILEKYEFNLTPLS